MNDYNFGNPMNARRWGAMIGHFTQMVWKDTKAIGELAAGRVSLVVLACRGSPARPVCVPVVFCCRLCIRAMRLDGRL